MEQYQYQQFQPQYAQYPAQPAAQPQAGYYPTAQFDATTGGYAGAFGGPSTASVAKPSGFVNELLGPQAFAQAQTAQQMQPSWHSAVSTTPAYAPPVQMYPHLVPPIQTSAAQAGFNASGGYQFPQMGQKSFAQEQEQQQLLNPGFQGGSNRGTPNNTARGAPSGRGSGGRGRGDRGGRGRGAPRQARSPFVEQFRMQNSAWSLKEVLGHAVELGKDQEGSRFIQRMLDSSPKDSEDVKALFEEVLSEPLALMTDAFGNYIVQKMLSVATEEQLERVVEKFKGNVIALTLHMYGCRVVQKAIESFGNSGRTLILGELRNNVAHCVQDQNGNHVVQKCIEHMPDETHFIVESLVGRVPEFATHAYGCRVVQCVFAHESPWQADVLREVVANVEILSIDQFGNYVVQYVLQKCKDTSAVEEMIGVLRPKFYTHALHKFASNVMEKLYARLSPADRTILLKELTSATSESESRLMILMNDQFGNYVAQQMIDVSDDAQRQIMVDHIQPYVGNLRRVTFGKHIVAHLERCSTVPADGAPVVAPSVAPDVGRE